MIGRNIELISGLPFSTTSDTRSFRIWLAFLSARSVTGVVVLAHVHPGALPSSCEFLPVERHGPFDGAGKLALSPSSLNAPRFSGARRIE